MSDRFPIDEIRHEFPSLGLRDHGKARVYLDNPAGTQVPSRVAEAAKDCYLRHNANLGGAFVTSTEAGAVVARAHAAAATFVGAASAEEVVIGPSMTGLTFHISRSIGKTIGPGDEVVVTRMDHDGNIAPWLMMAQERGATVRWLPFDGQSWVIDPRALDAVLSERTKLVALNAASNLTGSMNDVARLVARIHESGALVYVDAVQYSPHELTDVQALGCDFLACSSYKFYGPHLGLVWGRKALLQTLEPYKVRPMHDELPDRWETGTPQIELQAALSAAIDYYGWLGSRFDHSADLRTRIAAAFEATKRWEQALAAQLIGGLREIDGVTVHGITDPLRYASRVPTVSFTHAKHKPAEVARALAARNIFVWSGHNYALEIVRQLGIDEADGVVRIGMAHYNTPDEVDQTLSALEDILR